MTVAVVQGYYLKMLEEKSWLDNVKCDDFVSFFFLQSLGVSCKYFALFLTESIQVSARSLLIHRSHGLAGE